MKKYLKLLPLMLLLCFNVVFAANAENYTHYEWKCIQNGSTNVSKSDTILSKENGGVYTTSMFYSNTGTNLPANCIGTGSKNTYTVTFNDAGNGSSLTKNSNGSLTATSPTKTGYTFSGWTSSDSSVKCDNIVSTYKGNLICTANWTPIKYVLDVNGLLDGTSSGNVSGYGTFDVYVNGALVVNDVHDYYAQLDYGSTYQITDIKALTGRTYNGVSQGSLSGTISGTTSIQLNFTRNTYTVDINTIVNGTRSNTGVAGYTFDVYVNGTKRYENIIDFCENVYYGDVVKVVQNSNTGHDNWLSASEVTITGTTEIIAYWNRKLPSSFSVESQSGRLYNNNADLNVEANQMYVVLFLGNTSDKGAGVPQLSTNISSDNSTILYSEKTSESGSKRQQYLVFIPKSSFKAQIRSSCDSQQSVVVVLKGNTAVNYNDYNSNYFNFASGGGSFNTTYAGNEKWGYVFLIDSWYDTSEPSISISSSGSILDRSYAGDGYAMVRIRIYDGTKTFSVSGSTSDSKYPVQNFGVLSMKEK